MTDSNGEMLNFVVSIPRGTLADLALNIEGVESIDGATSKYLSDLLKGVIAAGLEEYLGEVDDIAVHPA